MHATIKIFLMISFAFLMSSCVSKGEVSAKSVVSLSGTGKARITADTERTHGILRGLDKKIGITSLDGKSLLRMGWDTDFPESLIITPGKHVIGVRYMYMNEYANGTIWLDAESEKSYIIKKELHNDSVSFWVEEADTGKRVEGFFVKGNRNETKK